MPLPAAPTRRGARLKNIPEELSAEAPARKLTRRTAKKKAAAPLEIPEVATAPAVVETPEVKPVEVKAAEAKAVKSVKPAKTAKTTKTVKATKTPKAETAENKETALNEVAAPVIAAAEKNTHDKLPHLRSKRAERDSDGLKKLYVLDTNVLLHDPTSLFRFEEHDVYLPMVTLEELDNHKTGTTDVARNARQVSRTLDALMQTLSGPIAEGVALNAVGNKECTGRLYVQTEPFDVQLAMLPQGKADNQILSVVEGLHRAHPDMRVILVSKDINMRLKATALNLTAEDYFNDKMMEDSDLLYTGSLKLSEDFWSDNAKTLKSWQQDGGTWYSVSGATASEMSVNEFVWMENGGTPFYGQVQSVEGGTATFRVIRDYMNPKNAVWGINARNREQSFALNLLMDPEIDFVTLLGQAGTGKTLLALAAALTQTLETRRFSEIIVTRATISVGEDIGFLPGTEEEKMTPWLGAIDDNLEVLNHGGGNTSEWSRKASEDLIRSRIRIKSMSFMRGRTFLNKFVIIDEAQNLTPKQMKTLITRAGPGTKIVCLGNIAQIDTPYLTEGSSGLTYVVDRFKGWKHAGHITMQRGERSRLADFASDAL